jgi:hypothetical protein
MPYFTFHMKMMQDVKEAQARRCQIVAEPSTKPTKRWLRETVDEIAKSGGVFLSNTARKKAADELKRVILQADKDGRCQPKHRSLEKSLVSVACFLVVG